MKISYEWLKEWVDLPWSPQQTAEKLTEIGFPVEGMTVTGIQISNIVSAKILHIEKHPNADRLRIAKVNDGTAERTIVCGAPNIEVGQTVPLALPGTKFPNGLEIVISKIRGIESQGMLCSERELGLSDSHSGIMLLPAETNLGVELSKIMPGDVIFDMDVTPNRPDMLSHVGVAREIAALTGQQVKSPKAKNMDGKASAYSIKIDEPTLCSRYIAKEFVDIKVGVAPEWMRNRLQACGIRSINNVVDITNYVLLEFGHPLHAFDADRLDGNQLIVRRAHTKEKFLALDEKTYELGSDQLVIADAKNAVAIAGVMGGQHSGVNADTKRIVLESAVFDRSSVRLTSKALALKSESSIRFEKGTDVTTAERASERATALISELAQGKLVAQADIYPQKRAPKTISLPSGLTARLLGESISNTIVENILKGLEFGLTKTAAGWDCSVPDHRKDMFEAADLVEEVARLYGYNKLPTKEPVAILGNVADEQKTSDYRRLTSWLKGVGYNETITSSFTAKESAFEFGYSADRVVDLTNPLSQEESILRPLVLLNLLKAVSRNVNTQRQTVKFFEIGKRFGVNAGKAFEENVLTVVAYGYEKLKSPLEKEQLVDFYLIKGLIETCQQLFQKPFELIFTDAKSFLHPYQSFRLISNKQEIGFGGVLHPTLAAHYDLSLPCVVAEIKTDTLLAQSKKYSAFSKQPYVERDLAILVAAGLSWAELEKSVVKAAGDLLTAVVPFDVYQGDKISADKKSVAFRMTFQHAEKTLTDADINGVITKVTTSLKEACGAELR